LTRDQNKYPQRIGSAGYKDENRKTQDKNYDHSSSNNSNYDNNNNN